MKKPASRTSQIATIGIVAALALFGSAGISSASKGFTGETRDGLIHTQDIAPGAVTTPKLAPQAVTTSRLRDGAVTNRKLRNGAVTGAKVKDGSLTAADFSGSVVGATGPAGPTGAQGPAGPQGDPGMSGFEVVDQTYTNVYVPHNDPGRGLSQVVSLTCPSGKKAVSGGFDLGTGSGQYGEARSITASASEPSADGNSWNVQLFNNSTNQNMSIDLKVSAVCVTMG